MNPRTQLIAALGGALLVVYALVATAAVVHLDARLAQFRLDGTALLGQGAQAGQQTVVDNVRRSLEVATKDQTPVGQPIIVLNDGKQNVITLYAGGTWHSSVYRPPPAIASALPEGKEDTPQ